MHKIDQLLNELTMYRLVLYILIAYLAASLGLSALGKLPFTPLALVISSSLLLAISYTTNYLLSTLFKAPRNSESSLITALILACIITPSTSSSALLFMGVAGVIAMSSKYILVRNKRHIFNPAAIAVVITSLAINQSASWWIGTGVLLPLTVVGGYLIVKKINRDEMILSFFIISGLVILSSILVGNTNLISLIKGTLLDTPLVFFASVMLTEPLTTPPTRLPQIIYGGIVGLLFVPQLHLGSFYTTPEMALCLGNLYSFLAGPKRKFTLTLKNKVPLTKDIYEFVFSSDVPVNFLPGQYLEWTLTQPRSDSRGDRRYFTIASAPTEKEIRAGVKFNPRGSSFKNYLLQLKPNQSLLASQLCGNFTLPQKQSEKLVFLAGGIGITPFRSMVKYLIDNKEKRDIILVYSAKQESDLVYRDIFDQASEKLGIRVFYFVGRRVDQASLKKDIPDYKERTFYISGPLGMVTSFKDILRKMGVKKVVTDYFPGFDN